MKTISDIVPQFRYDFRFRKEVDQYDIWDHLEKVYLSETGYITPVKSNDRDYEFNISKEKDAILNIYIRLNDEYDRYIHDISKLTKVDFT